MLSMNDIYSTFLFEITYTWILIVYYQAQRHPIQAGMIFNMLGEASTTKIAINKDAPGFDENKDAAKEGGTVAGVAREELEKRSGEKVVSNDNYLNLTEKKSIKQIKD